MKKTKLMLFNPCKVVDFQPTFAIDDHQIEFVEEFRLLGLVIRSDLKWKSNTCSIVKKANQRLWMIKRLKNLGADNEDLVDVFVKQIRSVLEFGVPVWNSSVFQNEKIDIERVQKSFCKIVLGDHYLSYENALNALQLENLDDRRTELCLKFALKAEKHEKFRSWFKPNAKTNVSRTKPSKYVTVSFNHEGFKKSPLSYLTQLLNMHYS